MAHIDLCRRLRLYVVIDPSFTRRAPIDVLRGCIEGGATAIQLRSKTLTDRETLDLAVAMRALTAESGVLFFVNDRLDLAMAAKADGVHLGVDDLPVTSARALAGSGMVIGYSPETDGQTAGALQLGASYLGVGPVFGTASKVDAGPAVGLGVVCKQADLSGLPVVGIGGINECNARSVIDAGACGVAVMSSIISSDDPAGATRLIASALG